MPEGWQSRSKETWLYSAGPFILEVTKHGAHSFTSIVRAAESPITLKYRSSLGTLESAKSAAWSMFQELVDELHALVYSADAKERKIS